MILAYERTEVRNGQRELASKWQVRVAKPPVMPPSVIQLSPSEWTRSEGDTVEIWRVDQAA